jgi:hypothetical protein
MFAVALVIGRRTTIITTIIITEKIKGMIK